MSRSDPEEITNEEFFENSFHAYIFCLGALASGPEEACERYGNYNVSWEIKYDVSAGVYLANNPAHRLTEQQVSEIKKLADVLDSLPASVLKFTNIGDKSLENMRHPAWEPPRMMAGQLMQSLRLVERNTT
jgi:hypothetical protein